MVDNSSIAEYGDDDERNDNNNNNFTKSKIIIIIISVGGRGITQPLIVLIKEDDCDYY